MNSDRAKDFALSAAHGIDEVMKAQKLDALLFPAASGASIAAKPGYPTVIVPFGTVTERAHAGVSRRIRCPSWALRRRLQRDGMQRATTD